MKKHIVLAAAALGVTAISILRTAEAAPLAPAEEYRLVGVTSGSASYANKEINELAEQGWKVRCGTGQYIILARDRRP